LAVITKETAITHAQNTSLYPTGLAHL